MGMVILGVGMALGCGDCAMKWDLFEEQHWQV